ncbi:MAG TPA: 4-hydroxyphenylacetate 3-hydroxylase N-terminal domain-containing protein [Vicinamibacterales bacterium]|jgi:4-hydroxybutyryl-CoA dehydratase/vinylacetyl-CoA-Delta-isomerase
MSDSHAIWVHASHHGGRIDAVAMELLGKAHELAAQAQAPVEAIVIGHEVEPLAAQLLHAGAVRIRVLDDPSLATFSTVRHARALAGAVSRHQPQVLLLGADNENTALAARLAARLGTGLSAHCVDLKLERGLLVQTVPGFGGQLMANIVCPRQRPQMATVIAGVFGPVASTEAAEIVRETVDPAAGGRTAREVERRRRPAGGSASLTTAEVVVGGGFGVGSKDRWALLDELAQLLDGVVGATRPPVDEGWARADQMIGASGKFIAPRLYIAAGISGMMHHAVGIHGAKTIVAINSDARAPIFAMADYGIVGDLGDVLPALIHHLRTGEGLAPQIQPPEDTKTPEEFKTALRRLRPNLYKHGRLVEDPVEDPVTRRTVEGHAQIFEAARDPRHQDLMTTTSHLTGRRISRYLSVIRSVDDMVANSRMKRLMFQRTGTCTGGRCAGWAALNAMWSSTWDMDHALGTDYHERLKAWLVAAQERDITLSGALTDPKGNRRLGPSKQADPDMYLRIVERRPDGIVVRGAKVMICGTAAAHEIFVMPGVKLRREDADYAVSFAIPKDAPGITIVEARHASDDRDLEDGFDNPVTRGGITQAYIFFEDVFVPKSRVFMCGEYAHAGEAVFRFTLPYRSAIGACVAGQGDVMVGAAILIARANGLDEKVFRDKLTQMIVNNETTFGVGLAASMMGTQHPSGAWLPDPVLAHANKVHVASLPYETKRLTLDIAGGIAETGCMPSYQDLVDSRYGHLVQKYLKANSPAETRMRIARLIEWLTAGAGVPGCMHGGGSPDGARMVVYAYTDFPAMIEMAKRVGGIADISLAKPPAK